MRPSAAILYSVGLLTPRYSMASADEAQRRTGAGVEGNYTAAGEWVLLSYRLPREPSTPRIALWRKLKKLGVAQLADGVAALPADARTREQFEWLAEEVVESGGQAGVWLARPSTASQERELAGQIADARAAEYLELESAAAAAAGLSILARAGRCDGYVHSGGRSHGATSFHHRSGTGHVRPCMRWPQRPMRCRGLTLRRCHREMGDSGGGAYRSRRVCLADPPVR